MFRLLLKPTGTGDGVEMQRVLLDKVATFEDLDVRIGDKLHVVFHRHEEERFQIVEIVDGGIRHRVDGLKDAFPRLCGSVDVDVRWSAGGIGGGLGTVEHIFEDRGCERQDVFVNAEVTAPHYADYQIGIVGTEDGRHRDWGRLGLYDVVLLG